MKLSKKKLAAFMAAAHAAAAGGSHDHINEVVHDTATDEVDRLLKEAGLDYDKLNDEQRDELLGAYKDGFWNPSNTPDLARIVIHLEGGLVQGITTNMAALYIVADTDTGGSLEIVKLPKPLQSLIASKRMNRAVRLEGTVNVPAVDSLFNLVKP